MSLFQKKLPQINCYPWCDFPQFSWNYYWYTTAIKKTIIYIWNKKKSVEIFTALFFFTKKKNFTTYLSCCHLCKMHVILLFWYHQQNFLEFWHRAESDAKTNPSSTRKTCIHFQKMLYCLEKVGSVLSSCGKISQKHHL